MKLIDLGSPTIREEELSYEEIAYPISSRTYLSEPVANPSTRFFDIVNKRKSNRNFQPLSAEQLNSLLWHSSRTIHNNPPIKQIRWEHRPAPSAGGRHPIDIFINRKSESRSLFLYQTIPHALAALKIDEKKLNTLLSKIEEVLPRKEATIIWFGAQFERTLSRYERGDSLIWKDAGALTATIAFVAEALKLNSCPIGITGEPYFSNCFDTTKLVGMGGIYVGSR